MSAYAISCPNCGGSLEVIGGRQIVTITCRYCGSVLDMNDEYSVLSKFSKVSLPRTPFRLGMSGKIKGVRFTIIGMVTYSCIKGVTSGEDTWTDFMLHSSTHGYAWLSYEEGSLMFSRRSRSLPSKNLLNLEPKAKFKFVGRDYQFYERYVAYITFVQGELTWIAKKGDSTLFYESISPPFGLSYEKTKNETEYFSSEYLEPQEVYSSFKVKSIENEKFNPLKPFEASKSKAFAKVSLYTAILSLAIIVVISLFFSGSKIAKGHFASKKSEMIFHINNPSHLVELDINTNLSNDWIYLDVSVVDAKTKEEVYALGKEVSYYHGYEGGESWSEGSKDAQAYFKVKNEGDYILKLDRPEYHRNTSTNVNVNENVVRSYYFVALFIFSIAGMLVYIIQYASHHTKLWKHLDEDDDD